MAASISISADVAAVVRAAFSHDATGHVLFGFAGRTAEPTALDAAVAAPIVIRDYLMERGIKYTVQLIADGAATTLMIDDAPDDRVDSVVWFARKHLLAAGLVLADSSGDSTVV